MNKVEELIGQSLDPKMSGLVIAYIMSKGVDYLSSKVTPDDISKLKGVGNLPAELIQKVVETAVKISKECSIAEDIIPFITGCKYM